ncbi:hypothetical protein O1611_g1791 [Lasiodiplodia mahajangana]|uniref:Uncharacterized protein n=1 Tax=Lasiodiplodia mahajangana TaxID=1108764 RepID=A0ACC2JX26_9PEZI|nr:hypothetical protein O1611_g1791 [Lasiodiplodia mahajangana]
MPDKWALLIGVDFYFRGEKRSKNPFFNHLRGCVRDVSRIEEYLRKKGVSNIEKLTATYDGNDTGPKETENLPTYDNIKEKLNEIKTKVKQGDLLHIHFSGHGILRVKLDDLGDAGDAISGTALALTDVMCGGAYLTGYQLGAWVRALVEDKKVRVSITLDSCYSGRALRGDDGDNGNGEVVLRTSEEIDYDESYLDSDENADAEVPVFDDAPNESDLGHRDAKVKRSWLSNPEGCTVLTACQLNQRAGEYKFHGQEGKNGILTHWMLDIMNRQFQIQTPTYARIAHYVKSSIKTRPEPDSQTPVLYGDGFYEFFSDQQFIQHQACLLQEYSQAGFLNKKLVVDVGAAQGVAPGATYSVYPSIWSSERPVGAPIAKIRIDDASAFQSQATLIDANNELTSLNGSLAVLNEWSLPSQQRVEVQPLPGTGTDDELQTTIAKFMEKMITDTRFSSYFQIGGKDSQPCNFIVSLDIHNKNVEIKDGQNKSLSRVPTIPLDEDAGGKVVYMLKHLARFKALEAFDYAKPPSSLAVGDYKFELLDDNGGALGMSGDVYEASNKQEVTVQFENNSASDNVHVAIFVFGSAWEIQRIHPENGQPTAHVPANRNTTCDITMYIPKRIRMAKDLFRAYVFDGDHPPSWDELVLPGLTADADFIPTRLPVEPVLEEDVEDEGAARDAKKGHAKRRPRKVEKNEPWAVLDFWVHTSEARS